MPTPRASRELIARKRVLPFSFFPVGKGTRRYGIFDAQFASSPWAVMHGAIARVRKAERRTEGWAFLEHAHDFYATAAGRLAAHPLLFYYAFLNLAKALLRARGFSGSLDRANHGLYEQRPQGAVQPEDVNVVVADPRSDRADIYAELVETLGFPRPTPGDTYPVSDLMVVRRLVQDRARRRSRLADEIAARARRRRVPRLVQQRSSARVAR